MPVGRPMMVLAKMRVHLLRRNNYLIIYIIGAMTDGCRSYLVVASGGFAFLSFIFFDRNDEMNI